MWVWMRSTVRPYFETMPGTVPSSMREYQIPKELEGPPTFVLENPVVDEENPPEPVPGLRRMPTFCPVPSKACPIFSTCDTELEWFKTRKKKGETNSISVVDVYSERK
jgi:hypothetical protein